MSVVVPFKRSRPETCLSDFVFDQMLASELGKVREREVRKHLFGCVECTARMETLRKARDEFLAGEGAHLALVRESSETRAPVVPARRSPFFSSSIFGAAVAAAAVLFGVMLSVPLREENTTRPKGSDRLGFYVKHKTEVRRGANGEVVGPGDALRFTYSLESPRHLAIISVDAAKKASIYFPEGQVTEELPVGRDVALPLAALLDDTLGSENIYGIFCESEVSVEAMRNAFAEGQISAPKGCELEKVTIEKR